MIPSGTRFIGISPTVDLTERRSALLNKQTEPFTVDDIRGYKVYTALLTQSGGSNVQSLNYSDLTIGVTYWIADNAGNGDFTNVGAPNNNIGTYFVATGTTPNSWGDGGDVTLSYDEGTPVVTVLENTIGSIWFEYNGPGVYACKSNSLFTENKINIIMGCNTNRAGDGYNGFNTRLDSNELIKIFTTYANHDAFENGLLSNTGLEIRIYN